MEEHSMNRKLIIGIAGGTLALILAGGAVYAESLPRTASTTTAQSTATPNAQPNSPGRDRAGQLRKSVRLARGLIQVTADATGTQAKDVVAALKSGQSLSQYAQAHGKTDAEIIGAARTKLDDRLKQAVSGGKLTQERADALLRLFDDAAPKVMTDQKLGDQLTNLRQNRRRFGAALIKATADVTGTTPADVRAALQGGQSLAQYAEAHGKSADNIVAKLREQGETRLANMLEKARALLDKPGLGRNPQPTATP
jgi:hypothetical protein